MTNNENTARCPEMQLIDELDSLLANKRYDEFDRLASSIYNMEDGVIPEIVYDYLKAVKEKYGER